MTTRPTIPRNTEHGRGIFMLSTTGASQVARLYPGDTLIIGRDRSKK